MRRESAIIIVRPSAQQELIVLPGIADIIVLDIPNHRQLPYWFGVNLVAKVVKNGVIIE